LNFLIILIVSDVVLNMTMRIISRQTREGTYFFN